LYNYVFTELSNQKREILINYNIEKHGNKLNVNNYQIMDSNKNSLIMINSKNSLVFSFYAAAKTLKRTFEYKSKDYKAISFKRVSQTKISVLN
jgi:hypothetical protein